MTLHHLQVTTDGAYCHSAKVLLDGYDIAPAVHALDLHLAVGNLNTATVHMLVGLDANAKYVVRVDPATRGALVALGWTPPGEATELSRATAILDAVKELTLAALDREPVSTATVAASDLHRALTDPGRAA